MRFPNCASIRARLVLLVLLAVLPALALMLFTGNSLHQSMVRSAQNAALRQVQTMAAHHERVVDNARLILATLVKAREIQALDAQGSQILLDDMRQRYGVYAALGLTDATGHVLATSPTQAFADADVTGSVCFQEARRTGRFCLGRYHLLPATGHVVIEFVQPVLDAQGAFLGMLLASFDLSYFGHVFADAHLPEGSVFTLTDSTGMRLTRFPETLKYTWVADLPQMVARMSGEQEEGVFLDQGVDQVRRLYSFKRLRFADSSLQLMIRLGLPEDLALAQARWAVLRNFVLLALAAGLALLAAWVVGDVTIMRRLRCLMVAADCLGTGDLHTRTGLSHTSGELGRLAQSFDRMAEGLQAHDQERRRAEEEVNRLNTELEERVVVRTAELAAANGKLHAALENLQQAQSQLVMSEKMAALGELVAGVAHEVNTPVGVALSATSALAEKTHDFLDLFSRGEMKRSDLSAYLEAMREGADMCLLNLNRASDMIRSFKMVAVDQASETRRVFNIREYVEQVLLSLRPKLKKTTHQVEIDCDKSLVLDSYPGAFSQILTNFTMNSLIHAFDEGQSGRIRIAVSIEKRTVILLYSDNGRGIPPQAQSKIFEPFYTTARAKGSTGLGLHIVFNLVTHTLGGTITCCSEAGQGTTFEVRIPLGDT